jgi:hypothetical protein
MNDTVKRAVEPGQTLDGRFQIVKRLGKGGVGEVFEVLDLGTHRRRALKLLQHQFTTDLATVEQFKREAAARGIADNHPAIVDVFTIGVLSDGRPFILMELLSGVDLDFYASQRGGKLEVAEAVRAVLVAADAVAAAHEKGLLHRDLKPSNIFRLAADDFRVLDFGMATLLGTLNADTGGTPAFSAPEQWVAFSTLSSRTDVFGLGATLYALIAGVPPIVRACPSAKNPGELIAALLASPKFPPLVEAPASVQAVIARALEPTAANRFRDAREFAEALRAAAPTVVGVAALALAPDAVPQEHEARAAFASTARLQTPNANAVDDVPGVMRRARTLADSYAAELTGVLRALRALGGFEELLTLATSAPHDVSRRAEVRELIGFSQNRLGQQAEAERTLSALLAEAPTGERGCWRASSRTSTPRPPLRGSWCAPTASCAGRSTRTSRASSWRPTTRTVGSTR